jgi:hypothetical protein
MAPRPRIAVSHFDTLPNEAFHAIMLALPVDARARAACVCSAWRAFLADPEMRQVLDLTPAGGGAAEEQTENLVRDAGRLQALFLHHTPGLPTLLLDMVRSHGSELQRLYTNYLTIEDVLALFAAAPRLLMVSSQWVRSTCTELLPFLRNGTLRATKLQLYRIPLDRVADGDWLALAGAVAAHQGLQELSLLSVRSVRGVNALVEAAAERGVSRLRLTRCALDGGSILALASLLQRGSLTTLAIFCDEDFPRAHMPALWAALRACRTLEHLHLRFAPPRGATSRVFTELLDAVASLPALSELDLHRSRVQDPVAAGHALGALLAANLPSLRILRVSYCNLGDEAMAASRPTRTCAS